MAEATEELEPLFDYSRVQPLPFVFLDDDTPPVSPKRDKSSNPVVKSVSFPSKVENNGKVTVNIDVEEEEDWLLPPPSKVSTDPQKLVEDSTLKELRLKKQELESFTRLTEDALRAVYYSKERELGNSLQSSTDNKVDQTSKSSERAKIVISIQDKDSAKQFRIYMDDRFERIFKMYADKVKIDIGCLVFSFDGERITPTTTPLALGMEDGDIVEAHLKPK